MRWLLPSVLLLSCFSAEPEPLVIGKDVCTNCKMTISDPRFGAEIVTKTGKVYKFDDVACMVNFFWNSGELSEEKVKYFLVIDYSQPGKLIDATKAFYVQSEAIHSPMASDVAAFEDPDEAETFLKEKGGVLLNWTQVTESVRRHMGR